MPHDLLSLDVARAHLQQARSLEVQARQDAGGATTIGCYGVGYGVLNAYGRVFVPGAFGESLQSFSAEKPLPIGWSHNVPIGKFTTLEDQAKGPYLEGPLSQTSLGQDAAVLVRDGLTAVSIGFSIEDYQDLLWAEPNETCTFETPFGTFTYQFDDYVLYIIRAQARECSLVLVGADDDARVAAVQSLLENASRALPGLKQDSEWEGVAYSMALLMGGRGAAAFADAGDVEHHALYQRLAAAYARLGKTPPAYARAPKFDQVAFQHDERAIFADRYLRKSLAAVTAGAGGLEGPLSAETLQEAKRAIEALEPLTQTQTPAPRRSSPLLELASREPFAPTDVADS